MAHPDNLGIPDPSLPTPSELDDATRGLTLRELVLLVWAEQKKMNEKMDQHIQEKVHPGAMTRAEAYGAMISLALIAVAVVEALGGGTG